MIFNTYKTIEDLNVTGINGLLVTASEAVDFLPGLLLFAIFIVLAFGSYFATQRRYGKGDLPSSIATAGLVTVVVSILFSLIPGFIHPRIIVITISLEIVFALWLFLSRE